MREAGQVRERVIVIGPGSKPRRTRARSKRTKNGPDRPKPRTTVFKTQNELDTMYRLMLVISQPGQMNTLLSQVPIDDIILIRKFIGKVEPINHTSH